MPRIQPARPYRLALALACALALLLPFARVQSARADLPEAHTSVRVVHAVPGAPAVDLLVDDRPLVTAVAFGEVSPVATVEPGKHRLTVVATGGSGGAIIEQEATLDEGSTYLFSVFGDVAEPRGRVNEMNLDALEPGTARLRLINLAKDAGEIDLVETGTSDGELFDRVAFDRDTPYRDFPVGAHALEVRGGERQETTLAEVAIDAADGMVYDLVVLPGADGVGATAVTIVTSASPPCSAIVGAGTPADACIRVVNASGQAGAGLAIGGAPAVDGLAAGEVTGFLTAAPGEGLALEPIGFPKAKAEEADLVAGQAYVIVLAPGDEARAIVAKTDLTPLPAGQARLRLIDAAPDLGELDVRLPAVDDQIPIYANLDAPHASHYRVFDAGSYDIELDGGDDRRLALRVTLEAGGVYDAVLRLDANGQPELLMVTAPAEIRGAEGTPVQTGPGATPIPASPVPTPPSD